MRLHYLQHVAFEGLGSIETWAQQAGHNISHTALYDNEPLPDINGVDCLVIMGAPMNIYQEAEYPWLVAEKRFIAEVIDAGKPVLGICFGAQLIADVLGAKVYPNSEKEIGWFPIEKTTDFPAIPLLEALPNSLEVFHWHGDTFGLPSGAQALFHSAVCEQQGFIYQEKVIALQFHLETTMESATALIQACGNEIVNAPYIQSAAQMCANPERFTIINQIMGSILNYLQQQVEK